MAFRFIFLLLCCQAFAVLTTSAQKSCGTVAYQEYLNNRFPTLEPDEGFEKWMSLKLQERSIISRKLASPSALAEVLTIPVVVHIIHNGEPVGTGSNLDDSRVLQQLQTLNEDYRRMNADTVNTPDQFKSVAADPEIEFVLAVRDPEGLPTSGINRLQGTRSIWDLVHNTELKSLSYWPAEDYLNLWVAPLDDLLGYAQFPVSSLQGLDLASENRLTDGVVIDSDFLGNNPNSNPESRGRTATHEIGHYLGLRHIWGDGGCGVDDFCSDTPVSSSSNFGCPNSNSCGSEDMVQNYLDLTDDQCMNLFTICQKDRMRVVMSNSPRRSSLSVSPGAQPPVMVANDAGIREISMPQNNNCNSELVPTAVVRNYGTNQISSFQIQLLVDNSVVETKTVNVTLDLLETAQVTFSSLILADMSEVEFNIVGTNGSTDGNNENNSKSVIISAKTFTGLPIAETFPALPANWDIRNDDNSLTWEAVNAPSTALNNTAVRVNFFSYDNADGEYDYLITPALDLTLYTGLTLDFEVAYAPFSANSRDGLIVAVSTDCGNTYLAEDQVFQKEGQQLATAAFNASDFIPMGKSDWRTETVDLSRFAGSDNVKIAFIGVNDFGNNLYLDNVNINGVLKPALDLAIVEIRKPVLVSCENNTSPQVVVMNTGLNPVSNFQLSYRLSSGATENFIYTGPPIPAGKDTVITFSAANLGLGVDSIMTRLEVIEGQNNDGNISNNVLQQPFIIDDQADLIPKIEVFETPLGSTDWRELNLDQSITWEVTDANGIGNPGNRAANLNFFDYPQKGAVDYLVSPVLDFSKAIQPTMTFDLAYAGSDNFNDGLLILISGDCGVSYSDTVFQAFGTDLATVNQTAAFSPNASTDWQTQTIDLSAYAGNNGVRVAFAGINDFGNNLFIDNIEFFISDRTTSLSLEENQMIVFPNPASNQFEVAFNLTNREDVAMQILDPLGRVVWHQVLTSILNQTFRVQLPFSAGIYILSATSPSFKATRKVVMTR